MNRIEEGSLELNKKILQSETYKAYIGAKARLNAYPQYKRMVDSFRKKQVDLETRRINGAVINDGEEFSLSNEYADICLVAVCNDFFQAEMELLSLLQAVYSQVCEGLDIDMDFMSAPPDSK